MTLANDPLAYLQVLSEARSQASPRLVLPYALLALVAYLTLTVSLRFRRCQSILKRYAYETRESMSQMTDHDAWTIQKQVMQSEFPFMILKPLQFALSRVCTIASASGSPIRVELTKSQTYGIPTTSALLLKTSQFSSTSTSLKRYADTGTLIGEFMAFEPRSVRAQTAIARTKFLQQGYRASGKILDNDMLYTLSLFALEPIRFLEQYEWREMTELEKCAAGTYWKSLGDVLDIRYDALPSGKTGFRDGLHWLEEIGSWAQTYEAKHMKPHARNKETADKTIDVWFLTYHRSSSR